MTSGGSRKEAERRALELLPWYVNGTLDGAERELVGSQVLVSLTCRRELDRLRRFQQLIQRDDVDAVATDRAFERLLARINSHDASSASRADRRGRFFSWIPLAVAAALIVALAVPLGWWTSRPDTTSATFETLSSPPPAHDRARLHVVFAPDVTEAERLDLLARHGLTVVGRPTADGIVTLTLADAADPAAVVAALKHEPRIRLVTTPAATDMP